MTTLNMTVDKMIYSLKEHAKNNDVPEDEIRNLFDHKDVNGLDELFQDGGEARCEHFTDHAMDYALEHGELETAFFEAEKWRAIEQAMRVFQPEENEQSVLYDIEQSIRHSYYE